MALAITDDHRALADTVRDLLTQRGARAAARALLEAADERDPDFWAEAAALGWLGLHVPEQYGGSGYTLEETAIVAEQLGHALAPGAFLPTMIASALIDACGSDDQRTRLLPGLADGSVRAGVSVSGSLRVADHTVAGDAGATLGAGLADLLVLSAGDDVVLVQRTTDGVAVSLPRNIDLTRRSGRVSLVDAACEVVPGAAATLLDIARLLLAAEATGAASAATREAAEYAKVRIQFGRPIAMYQAVKHHCANMAVASELATAAVWDAARAAAVGGEQFRLAAAAAASLASEAADLCANLNTQVHGGIGFTWEHDAHLFMRRATAIAALSPAHEAAVTVTDLVRAGVARDRNVDLPPEAEPIRAEVRSFVESVRGLDATAVRDRMIDAGYAVPHWPKPWGRAAGAIEQLVIEEEFTAAGLRKPQYGITGWVILTLVQHATPDQVSRWVMPALRQELIWCQLFSEPDAGSDAAGVKTKATRVDGGWLLNGQKVWTSGAHQARFGFITVRTNPDVPKHQGITTMVVDMQAKGVQVRPLRQAARSTAGGPWPGPRSATRA